MSNVQNRSFFIAELKRLGKYQTWMRHSAREALEMLYRDASGTGKKPVINRLDIQQLLTDMEGAVAAASYPGKAAILVRSMEMRALLQSASVV